MEEKEFPFEFSVVMAVYNVEPFLREAVDSLIAQDFGFDRIQLIMVDDGSTDGSGVICDMYAQQYPDNVMVVHKENGGLSSARNVGLKYTTGHFVNFFDPDDFLDKNVFSSVYKFFIEHETETDVVSIPLIMFGEKQGPHPANDKFARGNRVIDLEKEWWYFQMSLASAFLKSDIAKKYCFYEDLKMPCSEDSKELFKIFLRNPTLGVVGNVKYHYRKRSSSLVGGVQQNPLWYSDYLRDYCWWAIQYSIKQTGNVPLFIQYTIMYDLQWKLRQTKLPDSVLSENEQNIYRNELLSVFQYIRDEVITKQKSLAIEHKSFVLSKKYNTYPSHIWLGKDLAYVYNDVVSYKISDIPITLEFVEIRKNEMIIEGWFPHYVHLDQEAPNLVLKGNGEIISGEFAARPDEILSAGTTVVRKIGFQFTIPLQNIQHICFRFYWMTKHGDVWSKRIRYGKYFAIDDALSKNYFWKVGWKLTGNRNQLWIDACGRKGHLHSEIALLKELWSKNKIGYRKAVYARILYYFLRYFNHKKIWLICDKADRADDNGEAFFRYLQESKPNGIKTYFLLGKDSTDYHRIEKLGRVVPYMSWRHKLLFLMADFMISAYSHDEVNNPFLRYQTPYRDLLQNCRYIFLQHGIIKDDLSKGLNRSHKNILGFITSTSSEKQSILTTPSYMYLTKHIWLTGLPRYDYLYHNEENEIAIMPTWRRDLMGGYDVKNSKWSLKEGFQDSKFYKFYTELLRNKRLIENAEKYGYKINFVPHPVFFPYIDMFSAPEYVKIWGTETRYREVFARNRLLVTDFSSVAFDFAYLRKPVVYTHFDVNHYAEGYFDYERDGFGEVEYDLESTVDRIIEYMKNGCQLKQKYRERIDQFFAFNDQNNCQRVYEAIMELEGRA